MNNLIIYFLPTILALGIVTSYEDIKEGKIRNKYIVAGLSLGAIINIILLAFQIINLNHLMTQIIFFILAGIFSFVLWKIRIWSPGDAKLYSCYILLIPTSLYKYTSINIPIFELFINTVLPISLYYLITLYFKTNIKEKMNAVKKTFNYKNITKSIIIVFCASWIVSIILNYINIKSNIFYLLMGVMVLNSSLNKIFKQQTIKVYYTLIVLRILFDYKNILTYKFLISFAIITSGFIIIRMFINELSDYFVEEKNIYELKPGHVIAESITSKGLKTNEKTKENIAIQKNEKLSEFILEHIKRFHKNGKIHFNKIKIYQTIPFAPAILMGVMITLLSEGNIIIMLKTIIR